MARGTVFKKDTAWAFRVDLGEHPVTGRRQQVLRQGFTTKREAEEGLNELVRSRTAGTAVTAKRMKLGEFLDEWLITQQARLRETTHQSYTVSVARIKSVLGLVPLQSLAPLQIEAFYAAIGKPNEGRALSPKTIRNTHVVLRKALSDAERLGLVARNPGASARPPSFVRPEFDTWDSEQLRDFFAAAQGNRFFAAFVVSATTGMRRGEVLGLRWRDIDLDARQLAVVQTVTTVNNRVITTQPKTAKSRRTLFLDPKTVDVLREHRRQQREVIVAAGSAWNRDLGLVFCDAVGEAIHPDSYSREFVVVTRAAHLPEIRLHDLRHTYATLSLKTGIHPKVVSERLGHATVGITLDLYSHVTPSIAREAADAVAGTIFGA